MPARWPLGNDIVDLQQVDNLNSAANPRYIRRILAPEEFSVLSQAPDRHTMLWAMWAAKEAVYKSLKKRNSSLIFSHRRFLVQSCQPSEFADDSGFAQGFVAYQDWQVPVKWEWQDGWVHCVVSPVNVNERGALTYAIGELDNLKQDPKFTELRSKASSRHDASVAVRMLAKSMLEKLGLSDIEILRHKQGRRPGPPQIWQQGKLCHDFDLSLSHDGRYVAAAISRLVVRDQ